MGLFWLLIVFILNINVLRLIYFTNKTYFKELNLDLDRSLTKGLLQIFIFLKLINAPFC